MEQFEKWDKQNYPYPPCTERSPVNREMLNQRKHAWRGALEWVKRWIDIESFQNKIDKELEE